MSNTNWTREALKLRAKDVLRVNYWQAFLVSLLLGVATGGFASGGGASGRGSSGGYSEAGNQFSQFSAENPGVVAGFVIIAVLIFLIITAIALAFRAFVGGPLEVSCQKYFATNAIQPLTRLEGLGFGFRKNTICQL